MSTENIQFIETPQQKVAVLSCLGLNQLAQLQQQGFSGVVIVSDGPVETSRVIPTIDKLGGASKVAAIHVPEEKVFLLTMQSWNALVPTSATSIEELKTALIALRRFVVVSYK